MIKSNFNKLPFIEVKEDFPSYCGWSNIVNEIKERITSIKKEKIILTIECYHGVYEQEIFKSFYSLLNFSYSISTGSIYKPSAEIMKMLGATLTDDPVFGKLSNFEITDYFDEHKLAMTREKIEAMGAGVIFICGAGASLIAQPDILIYADMARWEIQQRFRKNSINNLGVSNFEQSASLKYKHAFFNDWRICDKHKKTLFLQWNYFLDTNDRVMPKLTTGEAMRTAMELAVNRPFELMPFFDPGPWGGQWMKQVCDLNREIKNFAWCFNCVPEENSLLIKINNVLFEMPAINLVFYKPKELLGEEVYARFGAEFPIRFDFLDTIRGGNLSLQVHPTAEYIQDNFSWPYTQDESYYMMDADEGAEVYLGLKENISRDDFEKDLYSADDSNHIFPDEKYVQRFPVKKHDHILIPAGTVHCSGKGCMVLEISSTPYIFTFKLWDWDRLGLNGEPRPTHINHGINVIQFNRTTNWTKTNLLNRIVQIAEGEGWREEKTGLHELEFIETRRYWFEKQVEIITGGGVNVLNLVEGDEIIVECPNNSFEPLTVHYAETFIIPAKINKFIIRPSENSTQKTFAVIKAFIREGV